MSVGKARPWIQSRPAQFELSRAHVVAQRGFGDQVQVLSHPVVDFGVIEPGAGLAMDLSGGRLEEQHMAAILYGGDIGVQRPPVIGQDGHTAGGSERTRDGGALELGGRRVPGDAFDGIGLAQTLEQPYGRRAGIEAVDVIDDHQLVAVFVEGAIHAEGGGIALEPAGAVGDGLAEELAFGQSGASGQDEEVKMALGKGIHEWLELGVGAHAEGTRGAWRRLGHNALSCGPRWQSKSLIGF